MLLQIPKKSESILPVVQQFKEELKMYYGSRLNQLILYGSYARGTQWKESDIDLLVVLNDINSEVEEINKLAELKIDLMLKYDVYISPNPTTTEKYLNSDLPLFVNIHKEGIEI